jgi:hypothetical protein
MLWRSDVGACAFSVGGNDRREYGLIVTDHRLPSREKATLSIKQIQKVSVTGFVANIRKTIKLLIVLERG